MFVGNSMSAAPPPKEPLAGTGMAKLRVPLVVVLGFVERSGVNEEGVQDEKAWVKLGRFLRKKKRKGVVEGRIVNGNPRSTRRGFTY